MELESKLLPGDDDQYLVIDVQIAGKSVVVGLLDAATASSDCLSACMADVRQRHRGLATASSVRVIAIADYVRARDQTVRACDLAPDGSGVILWYSGERCFAEIRAALGIDWQLGPDP